MAYTTQYIGSRYVPLFAEPAEWTSARTYEPLTIVMHEGNSYTSRQYVPVGIEITNEKFWALTGNYNAQIEEYKKETQRLAKSISDYDEKLESYHTQVEDYHTQVEQYRSDYDEKLESYHTQVEDYHTQVEQYRTENQELAESIKPSILAYNTIADAKIAADKSYIRLGNFITIAERPYVVSKANPNGMDNLMLTDTLTASLVIDKFLSPEDLQYAANAADAAPYINRCLELCRNTATVVLAHTYHIQTTIHASYADNIYVVGTAAIETDVSPAISFDVEHLTTDSRMRTPFNGNTLRIYSADRELHNDPTFVGVELKNAEEVEISNLSIYYMGTGIHIVGDNNYCITFRHCLIERDFYGVLYDADDNSSEKIAFEDCIFGHLYVCYYANKPTSTLLFGNTSFDFCNCGFFESEQGASNANITFFKCHIEGLGYYGPDMPKIVSNYYGIFVYCTSPKWTQQKYNFINCMVHVSQMQDELNLPLLVHNNHSNTYIENCTLSSKITHTNTIYPISTGYCNKGFYNDAGYFYVGSRMMPVNTISGPYIDSKEESITLTYRSDATNGFSELYNHIYLIFPQTRHFVIDADFTGNNTNMVYNNTYTDNTSGIHEIVMNRDVIAARVNLSDSTSKIVIRGIYPID